MKNFIKVIATTLLLATLVTPTFASNYVNVPTYTTPVDTTGSTNTNPATEVSGQFVLNEIKDKAEVTVFVKNESKVSDTILNAIKGTDKVLNMVANGYTISIIGTDVESAQTLNLNMKVEAPTNNMLVITPSQKGDFFATLTITIPAASLPQGLNKETAKVYYVADDGTRTEVGTPVFHPNGSVSFQMSHASHYEITSTGAPTTPTTPTTPGNPNTGDNSALPLAVGLFVAAIALISIFKNKKVEA